MRIEPTSFLSPPATPKRPKRSRRKMQSIAVKIAPSELSSAAKIDWAKKAISSEIYDNGGKYVSGSRFPNCQEVLRRAGLSPAFLEKAPPKSLFKQDVKNFITKLRSEKLSGTRKQIGKTPHNSAASSIELREIRQRWTEAELEMINLQQNNRELESKIINLEIENQRLTRLLGDRQLIQLPAAREKNSK